MNLEIYLTDHLAGADAACDVLARLTRQYPNGDLGRDLRDLLTEIRADKRTLEELCVTVGARSTAFKRAGGWLVEKAGRLKLSFRSERDAALSLLESLELLSIGVLGKRALWLALHLMRNSAPGLKRMDFEGLAARADSQHERLERYRLLAAVAALGTQESRQRVFIPGFGMQTHGRPSAMTARSSGREQNIQITEEPDTQSAPARSAQGRASS